MPNSHPSLVLGKNLTQSDDLTDDVASREKTIVCLEHGLKSNHARSYTSAARLTSVEGECREKKPPGENLFMITTPPEWSSGRSAGTYTSLEMGVHTRW